MNIKKFDLKLLNNIKVGGCINITNELLNNDINTDSCSYIFISSSYSSIYDKRKIHEKYCDMIPTFNMFCQVMDSLEQNEYLVICNDTDKINIEDIIYWVKLDKYSLKIVNYYNNLIKQKKYKIERMRINETIDLYDILIDKIKEKQLVIDIIQMKNDLDN